MQYINMRGRKCIWYTSKKSTLTYKLEQLSVHITWFSFFFFTISAVIHKIPNAERYHSCTNTECCCIWKHLLTTEMYATDRTCGRIRIKMPILADEKHKQGFEVNTRKRIDWQTIILIASAEAHTVSERDSVIVSCTGADGRRNIFSYCFGYTVNEVSYRQK